MAKLFIINDETKDSDPALHAGVRGFSSENRNVGYGQIYGAPAFPKELLIPRSEWQARIQEMTETKTRLSDLIRASKMPTKDQGSTNFCWANAPVTAAQIVRMIQNQPMVILSPASIACPINNFKNQGGWTGPAIEYIARNGIVPASLWPSNAIDRRYHTNANWSVGAEFKVGEWYDIVPRNLDQLMSCLLRRLPVCVGFDWWRHEVTAVDPVWLDGQAEINIWNSWSSSWGNGGFGILQGNKKLPDDCQVLTTATASSQAA